MGFREYCQVGLIHHGIEIWSRDGEPTPIADAHIADRATTSAFLQHAVLVGIGRKTERFCRAKEGQADGMRIWRTLNVDFTSGAATYRVRLACQSSILR